MTPDIPTTAWNVTYLVNLVILGLLVTAFHYFGLRATVVTFVLVVILAPISGDTGIETGTTEER